MSFKDEKRFRLVFSQDDPLNLIEGIEFVRSPKCGAINTFSGTIRDTDLSSTSRTKQPIQAIHYDVYKTMARNQIWAIVGEILEPKSKECPRDPNARVFVGLKFGLVPIGESSVVICVSSTGRHFSHKATMSILERIKSDVAIWKKIIFADGHEQWDDLEKSEAHWLGKKEADR